MDGKNKLSLGPVKKKERNQQQLRKMRFWCFFGKSTY